MTAIEKDVGSRTRSVVVADILAGYWGKRLRVRRFPSDVEEPNSAVDVETANVIAEVTDPVIAGSVSSCKVFTERVRQAISALGHVDWEGLEPQRKRVADELTPASHVCRMNDGQLAPSLPPNLIGKGQR